MDLRLWTLPRPSCLVHGHNCDGLGHVPLPIGTGFLVSVCTFVRGRRQRSAAAWTGRANDGRRGTKLGNPPQFRRSEPHSIPHSPDWNRFGRGAARNPFGWTGPSIASCIVGRGLGSKLPSGAIELCKLAGLDSLVGVRAENRENTATLKNSRWGHRRQLPCCRALIPAWKPAHIPRCRASTALAGSDATAQFAYCGGPGLNV